MAITAMPEGWILESGVLNTDVDEDRTTYNTGGRSLKLKNTGTTIIVMSQPIAVGIDSSAQDTVRRKVGVTLNFVYDGPAGALLLTNTKFGVRFYDATGLFLSTVSKGVYVTSAGSVFDTDGIICDIPATAQYCRPFVEHTDATYNLYVDHILPYAMPPYGLATFSGTQALVVGTNVQVPVTTVFAGTGRFGSHGINDDPITSGAIVLRETGLYTVYAGVILDAFTAADDAFLPNVVSSAGIFSGQIFSPAISKTGMTFAAGTYYDMTMCVPIPEVANDTVQLRVTQLAGTARNVTAGFIRLTKES